MKRLVAGEDFSFSSITISIHLYRFYYPLSCLFYLSYYQYKLNYFYSLATFFVENKISFEYNISSKQDRIILFLLLYTIIKYCLNLSSTYSFDFLYIPSIIPKFVNVLQIAFRHIIFHWH